MTRLYRVFAAVCVMAFLVSGLMSVEINASEGKKSIRIIYSNDMLGYTEPCG